MTDKKAQNGQTAKEEYTLKSDVNQTREADDTKISETWAEDTIAELDDFIESQGIYIRQ